MLDHITPTSLRQWLARRDISQSRLAKILDVPQPTVNRWCRGRQRIPGMLRYALAYLNQHFKSTQAK